MTRDAVLLMAYGSPDRLDQVEAYYTDIRRGNPPPPHLLEELKGRYVAIGGGSPLSRIVEEQRVALEAELAARGTPMPVYAGMRHIEPRIGDIVKGMAADGVERFVAIAMAPAGVVERGRLPARGRHRARGAGRRRTDGRVRPVVARRAAVHRGAGPDDARGARALRRPVDARSSCSPRTACRPASSRTATRTRTSWPRPRSSSPRRSASSATRSRFQSAGRTGEEWLGPDILAELRRLGAEGVTELVVRPVGFVADHLEVLFDIDIEAQGVAREAGIHLERARSMNTDPTFIAALADIAAAALRPVAVAPGA